MKIFFSILFTITVFSTWAQLKPGIKAGVNFCNWKGNDARQTSTFTSFNTGVIVNYTFPSSLFSVQAEFFYSKEGSREANGTDKIKMEYINTPLLLVYSHRSGFFAETGVQVGVLLSAKEKTSGTDLKNGFNVSNFQYIIGGGYKTKNGFGFNARYNVGLTDISASSNKITSNVVAIGLFKTFNIRLKTNL